MKVTKRPVMTYTLDEVTADELRALERACEWSLAEMFPRGTEMPKDSITARVLAVIREARSGGEA